MWQFQITKYDPNKRNELGHYIDNDEWTEYSDVGKSVSLSEYERIEKLYIDAALKLCSISEIEYLNMTYLEDNNKNCVFVKNQKIRLDQIESVMRSIFRGEYWAKLESEKGFIHIGWDYYMYIGTKEFHESAIWEIAEKELYVEQMPSPYNGQDS